MFDELGIRYLESYQTLLQPLAFPQVQEDPVTGYDGGGFIVIVGNKKIFNNDAPGNPKPGTSI
jgi:hypothetical protein